jgi:hypothetical protein
MRVLVAGVALRFLVERSKALGQFGATRLERGIAVAELHA